MKLAYIFVAVLLLAGCGVEQVDTGHRGVKTKYGEVDMKAGSLPEGLYFYNPLSSSITEMDVRTQRLENKAHTYTRDVQQAEITYVANYNLQQDKAHIMFKEVGVQWDKVLVLQTVEGALKQVIGQWDAVELISNREKATRSAEDAIKTAMNARGVNITRIELVNISYDTGFEKAVEQKVTAIQKAIEEQNRTKQVQEQAKQQVISAQATAESMRIRANALTQNKALIEYEAVQKWDGKMPVYMMGNSMPLINLNK